MLMTPQIPVTLCLADLLQCLAQQQCPTWRVASATSSQAICIAASLLKLTSEPTYSLGCFLPSAKTGNKPERPGHAPLQQAGHAVKGSLSAVTAYYCIQQAPVL